MAIHKQYIKKSSNKNTLSDKLQLANNLYINKSYDELIPLLKSIIKTHSTNYRAYYLLGITYEEMGKPLLAFNFYNICVQIKKKNIPLIKKVYELAIELDLDSIKRIRLLDRILKVKKDKIVLEEKKHLALEANLTDKLIEVEMEYKNRDNEKLKQEITQITDTLKAQKLYIRLFKKTKDRTLLRKIYDKGGYKFISKRKKYIESLEEHLIYFISTEILNIESTTFHLESIDDITKYKVLACDVSLSNILDMEYDSHMSTLYLRLVYVLVENKNPFGGHLIEFLESKEIDKSTHYKIQLKKAELTVDPKKKLEIYFSLLELSKNKYKINNLISLTYESMGDKVMAYEYSQVDPNLNEQLEEEQFNTTLEHSIKIFEEIQKERDSEKEILFISRSNILIREIFKYGEDTDVLGILLRHIQVLNLCNMFDKSIEILKLALNLNEIKSDDEKFILVILFGIKLTVLQLDMENFNIFICRFYTKETDSSIFSFLYMLYNFVPGIYDMRESKDLCRHFQRVLLRNLESSSKMEEYIMVLSGTVIYDKTFKDLDRRIRLMFEDSKKEIPLNIAIVFSSICFSHSKSRRIFDRDYVIQRGFDILRSKPENEYMKYNLARAYQYFGLKGAAEKIYLEFATCNIEELKMASFCNLRYIYTENNNKIMKDHIYRIFFT